MGWVLLTLRKQELQSSVADRQLKLLQISNQLKRLESFSSAISNGKIDPNEIASMGTSLFGAGLEFMEDSTTRADEIANDQTAYYADMWDRTRNTNSNVTFNMSFGEAKFLDENGDLNVDALYSNFVDENLKEIVQEYYEPLINEMEKELEREKTEQETLLAQEEAEMQSVGQSISQSISNSTIKLS